jgi:hypothetical protein
MSKPCASTQSLHFPIKYSSYVLLYANVNLVYAWMCSYLWNIVRGIDFKGVCYGMYFYQWICVHQQIPMLASVLVSLFVFPCVSINLCLTIFKTPYTYLCLTYLLLSTYYPPNLPIYLLTYLFIYLPTYYLPTYLPIYLSIYLSIIYLPIYLIRYLLTYLWKKLKFKCCYTHCKKLSWKFKETC